MQLLVTDVPRTGPGGDEPAGSVVPGRGEASPPANPELVEAILITQQNQLTSLSSQADTKASILLTACSLALSSGATRLDDPDLQLALALFLPCTTIALVFSVLTVLPSIRKRNVQVPPDQLNPFFFLHAAQLERGVYTAAVRHRIDHGDLLIDTLLADLHAQARYLRDNKFRHLRYGYLWLLAGFAAGGIGLAISAAT